MLVSWPSRKHLVTHNCEFYSLGTPRVRLRNPSSYGGMYTFIRSSYKVKFTADWTVHLGDVLPSRLIAISGKSMWFSNIIAWDFEVTMPVERNKDFKFSRYTSSSPNACNLAIKRCGIIHAITSKNLDHTHRQFMNNLRDPTMYHPHWVK